MVKTSNKIKVPFCHKHNQMFVFKQSNLFPDYFLRNQEALENWFEGVLIISSGATAGDDHEFNLSIFGTKFRASSGSKK